MAEITQEIDCNIIFGRGNVCASFVAGTDNETNKPIAIMKLHELEQSGDSGRKLSDNEKASYEKLLPILIVAFENRDSVKVVQKWLRLIDKFFKEREQNG